MKSRQCRLSILCGGWKNYASNKYALHQRHVQRCPSGDGEEYIPLPPVQRRHGENRQQLRRAMVYQEYGKLKKKVKQYDTIKQNVDSILRQAKQPEREKQTER